MNTIYPILLAIFILDFTLFGFIPYLFRVWPKFRHLLKEGVLLEDRTKGDFFKTWEGHYYDSLILTKEHLIIRNTFFTAVKIISLSSVELCVIKKGRKNKSKIIINFLIEDRKSKLVFKTNKAINWIKFFILIGVKVTDSTGTPLT
jgi:hypothetical protein